MGTTFGITELKKHLGPGFGLRKNRYMLEVPVPTVSGETLNILCQSAGLPERRINTTELWHKGRRYTVRGETDFIGEYEISIVDDSNMEIRKMFDNWLKMIDNTRPDKNSNLLAASFEEISPGLLGNIESALRVGNMIKNAISNPRQLTDFAIGLMDNNQQAPVAQYQVDINIWQMDRQHSQVYGYKLQNAFPKEVGIVTLDDRDENTLSEFSVTLAFSEFIPLNGIKQDLRSAGLGDRISGIVEGAGKLFD
jgi:hypothetical protein